MNEDRLELQDWTVATDFLLLVGLSLPFLGTMLVVTEGILRK